MGAPGLAFETWDPPSQGSSKSRDVTPGAKQCNENTLGPATPFHVTTTLSFVIPSEAEGSAVPRTIPGNVFDRTWRLSVSLLKYALQPSLPNEWP